MWACDRAEAWHRAPSRLYPACQVMAEEHQQAGGEPAMEGAGKGRWGKKLGLGLLPTRQQLNT